VTLRTGRDLAGRRHLVRVGEREARGRMVKFSIRPIRRVVTGGALGSREARRDVVGHVSPEGLGAIPIGGVAAVAIGVRLRQRVIVVRVTTGAGCGGVNSSECPACRGMVEAGHVSPGDGVVAG